MIQAHYTARYHVIHYDDRIDYRWNCTCGRRGQTDNHTIRQGQIDVHAKEIRAEIKYPVVLSGKVR